jgi:hypothetical protein
MQRFGAHRFADSRSDPFVDRPGGVPGELLVDDRPYQCAEWAVWVSGPMAKRPDAGDEVG